MEPAKKKKRGPRPVISYPHNYLSAWKEATKRQVNLDTKDSSGRKRIRLQQRLHAFRRSMIAEDHEDAQLLFTAEAVLDRINPSILILRPVATPEEAEMFLEAGIGEEEKSGTNITDEEFNAEMAELLKETNGT